MFTVLDTPATIQTMPELDEMITTAEAQELAKDMRVILSMAAISEAARRGKDEQSGIAGAIKRGNTWLLPRQSFLSWLNTRRPRGPKPTR